MSGAGRTLRRASWPKPEPACCRPRHTSGEPASRGVSRLISRIGASKSGASSSAPVSSRSTPTRRSRAWSTTPPRHPRASSSRVAS
eukprot:scaffold108065_cov60-Phaeocystis_antarctica.AAC.3